MIQRVIESIVKTVYNINVCEVCGDEVGAPVPFIPNTTCDECSTLTAEDKLRVIAVGATITDIEFGDKGVTALIIRTKGKLKCDAYVSHGIIEIEALI